MTSRALIIGVIGVVVTWALALVFPVQLVATGYLVGIAYCTAIAIGMLLLTMILHILDANWGTPMRRQLEHGLSAFKWLALLFLPLLAVTFLGHHRDVVWGWMSPGHLVLPEHKLVGQDAIYAKKKGFLSIEPFLIGTGLFFGLWIWLAARLRKASFTQDVDGSAAWTLNNRVTAAFGIPLTGLALTFAAIYWFMSLEYHWFSTMFGVWYFADCMRGCLSVTVFIMVYLWNRGDYKGILHRYHWHSIGQLMLAFTIFWAYIAFSQYFLIWNANVPEETFWFNEREFGGWFWVGMILVFCHFLLPFIWLLSFRFKVTHHIIRRIAIWILCTLFLDLCWNILPAVKALDGSGNPIPFFSPALLCAFTSVIGIGSICVWSYLRSFPTTKLIPIRDPRIVESLTNHDE